MAVLGRDRGQVAIGRVRELDRQVLVIGARAWITVIVVLDGLRAATRIVELRAVLLAGSMSITLNASPLSLYSVAVTSSVSLRAGMVAGRENAVPSLTWLPYSATAICRPRAPCQKAVLFRGL